MISILLFIRFFFGGDDFSFYAGVSNENGGWNKGSIVSLKVLSTTSGMILESNGQEISKHGLVLASMRYTLKFSSIMKS